MPSFLWHGSLSGFSIYFEDIFTQPAQAENQ
jgi:hypothetical protein